MGQLEMDGDFTPQKSCQEETQNITALRTTLPCLPSTSNSRHVFFLADPPPKKNNNPLFSTCCHKSTAQNTRKNLRKDKINSEGKNNKGTSKPKNPNKKGKKKQKKLIAPPKSKQQKQSQKHNKKYRQVPPNQDGPPKNTVSTPEKYSQNKRTPVKKRKKT